MHLAARGARTALMLLAFLGSGVAPATAGVPPCEGPDADPWVRDTRDRIMSDDPLFALAVELFGPPTSCEGALTDELDGGSFGTVVLGFRDGVTFGAETLPPESSVVELRAPSGFADANRVREAVERYAAGIGLAVDWSEPEVTAEGGEEVHTFRDPDPGLNASASLVYTGGKLVAVRVGMAL